MSVWLQTSLFSTTVSRSSGWFSAGRPESLPSEAPHLPGEIFAREIHEQPDALLNLLEHEAEYAALARAIEDRAPTLIRLVGHGSSDNAATYGVYAFGLLPRLTAVRDSISLSIYYDAELDFHRQWSSRSPSPVVRLTSSSTSNALA